MISKPDWMEKDLWRRCVEQRLALAKLKPWLYRNEDIPEPITEQS
jgi:hypothetical protein